jgi:hypothetical protein
VPPSIVMGVRFPSAPTALLILFYCTFADDFEGGPERRVGVHRGGRVGKNLPRGRKATVKR